MQFVWRSRGGVSVPRNTLAIPIGTQTVRISCSLGVGVEGGARKGRKGWEAMKGMSMNGKEKARLQ